MKAWLDENPLAITVLPIATLILAILNLTVPYLSLQPGPTTNVNRIISAAEVPTYPAKGKLLLTTVGFSRYKLRVIDALRAWLNPEVDVIPIEAYIPKGKTGKEVDRENTLDIDTSKQSAAAAALSYLGYPVHKSDAGARIEAVESPGPSAGILAAGDVVTAVDGQAIGDLDAFLRAVHSRAVGTRMQFTVLRRGQRKQLAITAGRRPSQPTVPRIGVSVTSAAGTVDLPVDVQFRTGKVGGPSAGLFFALGVIDLLRPGDLTGGRVIAGTGTIDADGRVGPVGGVRQKVAGAERAGAKVFICPYAEAAAAKAAASSVRVIGVRTLDEAVKALEKN